MSKKKKVVVTLPYGYLVWWALGRGYEYFEESSAEESVRYSKKLFSRKDDEDA
jgi:hypothetical protein